MRRLGAAAYLLFAILFLFATTGASQKPIPPGVRDADKQTNGPVEPPTESRQTGVHAASLEREAQELAQLSASVSADLGLVAKGQLPKDLASKLKRIEKLAKHLRNEISSR